MSLFYNPHKSGRGVSKEEAQTEMKPFFKFFEIFGRKFWYLLQLNFLYMLLCIPIITIGPATAALTQVMRKFVLEKPIFVFSEFFTTFKNYFNLQTIAIGIASLICFAASIFSIASYIGIAAANPGLQNNFMMAMGMIAGAVFLTMNTYIYPQIVCLELNMNAILKNSAKLCLLGLKRNVVTFLGFVSIIILLVFFLPFSLIALPIAPFSWLAFLSVFNAYPVIQRYIITPFYEAQGQKNPEAHDFVKPAEKTNMFTDMGGKEIPIDKKKVKTTGKIIK
jgi:uncharacterized membrane protein YesL